jgi:sterol desaturase/sphingolipid hydroxylase (fatty acid hydroxylase superfamily)
MDALIDLHSILFGGGILVAPEYLLLCIPIAWIIYRRRRIATGFWGWLVPRSIWLHPSHILDLRLFIVFRVMVYFGVFTRVSATPLVAAAVAAWIAGTPTGPDSFSPVALAFVLWIAGDFVNYWQHRIYHQWRVIWPLHAVHHSAEVMTPFTAYRQHPLALILSTSVYSVVIGALQGVLIGTLDPHATLAEIAGINAFLVIANLALANFHHSHIWISYGPILERLLISPAQHQIHHSTLRAHHNRNYGTTLALWDWMFGTLYVIDGQEEVRFGLDGKDDAPLRTHRLSASFWSPLRRLVSAGRAR